MVSLINKYRLVASESDFNKIVDDEDIQLWIGKVINLNEYKLRDISPSGI